VRHRHWNLSLIGWGLIFTLLLSACAAPAQPPNHLATQSADLPTCRLANLQEAAAWYNRYHALAPDDLLSLKKLAEVCTALEDPSTGLRTGAGVEDESCREAAERVMREHEGVGEWEIYDSPAAALRETLEACTDDRRIVAELLGVPLEDVELGPNLVENGGFEDWVDGRPEWWSWSAMFSREPFRPANFAGGAEGLLAIEGQQAARVDGFWIQRWEDKSLARAGFWQWDEMVRGLRPITLTMNVPYVLSFYYRTTRVPEGRATVWVSGEPDVFWAHDHGLPSTEEGWCHFVAVGWNRSDAEAAICPLVRSFAAGCAEFDNVQVRPIGLPDEATVEVGEARFWVSGQGN